MSEKSTEPVGAVTPHIATVASEGGKARAEKLSAEERRSIAKKAAEARWSQDCPTATHEGILKIGSTEIACYVLEDGERVISTRGVMKALGRRWRGRKYSGTELPVFLEAKNLKSYISKDLEAVLSVIEFRMPRGVRAEGFKAKLLPLLCETYLSARDAGVLTAAQTKVAKVAEILMRGLAHVGIIALIDEATGYQEVRDRQALQIILDKYLLKEFAAWAKRFPDQFYKEIFRLRGWQWKGMKVNRPQCVARYTTDLVYSRLVEGVVKELESRNPQDERGTRRHRHHQFFTEDVGHPALAQHLSNVITIMQGYDHWEPMMKHMNRALPKKNQEVTPLYDLIDDD
jgi:hypothetical protein